MKQYNIPIFNLNSESDTAKIQHALSDLANTTDVQVTEKQVTMTTEQPLLNIIQRIEQLGYEAGYHLRLPLTGLSCSKCVAKVEASLSDNPNIAHFVVKKTLLEVIGTLSKPELVHIIEQLGYSVPVKHDYHLTLSGLSCKRCIAKVEALFTEQDDIDSFTVTKTHTDVTGTITKEALVSLIQDLGYSVPETQTYSLPLAGLSCGKCVAKVEALLAEQANIDSFTVTKTHADITGTITKEALVGLIEGLGYSVPETHTYALPLAGLSCGKCVAKVEALLAEQANIDSFTVTKTHADVTGTITKEALVGLIESLGYSVPEIQTYSLPLAGLSCGKCVAKVEALFAEQANIDSFTVTKTHADVTGSITEEALVSLIESLGYSVPETQTYSLPLAGLSCGKCVAKVEALFAEQDNIDSFNVTKIHADVTGTITKEALVSLIEGLGYSVPETHTYALPLAGLSCKKCVAKVEALFAEQANIDSFTVTKTHTDVTGTITKEALVSLIEGLGYTVPEQQTLHLTLSGLSCGKCVAKVEALLNEQTSVSHTAITTTHAEIVGRIQPEEAIRLIEELGYQASVNDLTTTPTTEKSAAPVEPDIQETHADNILPTQQYLLSGITCASCVASVEKAIRSVSGVNHVSVNLAERSAMVNGTATPASVIAAVTDAGYGAELNDNEETRREKQQQQQAHTYKTHLRNSIIALAVGVPLMLWDMTGGSTLIHSETSQLGWGIVGLITLVLLTTIGRDFFINAWKAFKHHRATMDTLVALGTGAAWIFSILVVAAPNIFPPQSRHVYFEASAMIIGLITLGHALEAKARARTSKALERLIDLQPQTAIVVDNGQEKEVPLADVQVGMLLRLHPGAKVPVDGILEKGQTYIDEAMLTGEPLPSNKNVGDAIHAGTINQNGSILFIAQHIGADTMLSRIIQLVRQAQSSKPALARLADTISSYFVPAVMIIAIITAVVWYYVGPQPHVIYMLISAVTVLIIACPCALGLATPMAVTVGIGRAAEYGILIRNAEAMQIAASVDTIVIDKTGTLTEGKPTLTGLRHYNQWTEEQVLMLSASLEQGSEHPLAKAILLEAEHKSLTLTTPSDFNAKPGFGISGIVNGQQVLLGNQRLLDQHQVDASAAHEDAAEQAAQGATPIFVAVDGLLVGLLLVSDPLREDSIQAVKRLKDQGLRVIMLTGDIESTAQAIAKQANVDTVIAGVLPDGKAHEVKALQEQGRIVAMIGDGINDAPALAQAQVGIAMGSGSDVAIESAQFTLMRHSLNSVSDALALSKATLKNIKQNLFCAFIYNVIGIPVAAGVLFPITGHLLSPVVAGAAMALSSITVVTNANRLRLFKPNK